MARTTGNGCWSTRCFLDLSTTMQLMRTSASAPAPTPARDRNPQQRRSTRGGAVRSRQPNSPSRTGIWGGHSHLRPCQHSAEVRRLGSRTLSTTRPRMTISVPGPLNLALGPGEVRVFTGTVTRNRSVKGAVKRGPRWDNERVTAASPSTPRVAIEAIEPCVDRWSLRHQTRRRRTANGRGRYSCRWSR